MPFAFSLALPLLAGVITPTWSLVRRSNPDLRTLEAAETLYLGTRPLVCLFSFFLSFSRARVLTRSCSCRWGPCPSPTPRLACTLYLFLSHCLPGGLAVEPLQQTLQQNRALHRSTTEALRPAADEHVELYSSTALQSALHLYRFATGPSAAQASSPKARKSASFVISSGVSES